MPLKTAGAGGYSFYWTADERNKSVRRTLEWTSLSFYDSASRRQAKS